MSQLKKVFYQRWFLNARSQLAWAEWMACYPLDTVQAILRVFGSMPYNGSSLIVLMAIFITKEWIQITKESSTWQPLECLGTVYLKARFGTLWLRLRTKFFGRFDRKSTECAPKWSNYMTNKRGNMKSNSIGVCQNVL